MKSKKKRLKSHVKNPKTLKKTPFFKKKHDYLH